MLGTARSDEWFCGFSDGLLTGFVHNTPFRWIVGIFAVFQ